MQSTSSTELKRFLNKQTKTDLSLITVNITYNISCKIIIIYYNTRITQKIDLFKTPRYNRNVHNLKDSLSPVNGCLNKI